MALKANRNKEMKLINDIVVTAAPKNSQQCEKQIVKMMRKGDEKKTRRWNEKCATNLCHCSIFGIFLLLAKFAFAQIKVLVPMLKDFLDKTFDPMPKRCASQAVDTGKNRNKKTKCSEGKRDANSTNDDRCVCVCACEPACRVGQAYVSPHDLR